ncbi:MAG: prolipoprotein diacylglyceryl transferase [Candidatus Limnocylindrales bacterium]|nr:prolipoprotein diacylglyceryl transferase [Candidatus Limnocylindrales bacterium]
MPTAIIAFDFDPLLRLADGLVVRWQTVALVAIIAAALVIAGLIARREGLRPDDLLFIAVATVPGAVFGGRLGYVLLHVDYYAANTGAIVDPGQGSLELGLAVVGGLLSGSYVAALLGAPFGHWLRTAALPLLFVLGAGKLAMVLGGSGQGQPSDLAWATAFVGAGPWGSLAPELPSHPSQAYEGIATLVILTVLTLAVAAEGFQARDGRLFAVALGAWAVARAAISLTWRDPTAIGGLSAGGLIAAAIALGCLVAFIAVVRRRPGSRDPEAAHPEVTWADPETRPRF